MGRDIGETNQQNADSGPVNERSGWRKYIRMCVHVCFPIIPALASVCQSLNVPWEPPPGQRDGGIS